MVINCSLFLVVTKVFNQFCVRNERRRFLEVDMWQWPPLGPSDLALRTEGAAPAAATDEEEGQVDGAFVMKNARIRGVLTFIPQVPHNRFLSKKRIFANQI